MKKSALVMACALVALMWSAAPVRAQGAQRGPDQSTLRDAELERDSRHNLEVAQLYFKVKKAYRAAVDRCREIIEANPSFSRLDEVLYIAGMSSLYLSENRGKQKPPNKTPDQLREEAKGFLSQMVKSFPDSEHFAEAEKSLRALESSAAQGNTNKKP